MIEKRTVLTYEGLKNLEQELQHLKIVRRKEVAEKIKEARGQGDLSENAEYDSAKEEQAEIESRILSVEKMLRNAEIIDEDGISTDTITIGSVVRLLDVEFSEELEYKIVGSAEAAPDKGFISNESPLGLALMNRSAEEIVEVSAPDGLIEYKVLEIVGK
ncbi:MAG: transcription elongation factor GreA [Defluviitaleaceae bacterium]|nr:transcription elongation factor GreA [Defluviitaleaceae bacterium]